MTTRLVALASDMAVRVAAEMGAKSPRLYDDLERSGVIMVIGANPTVSAPAVGYAICRIVERAFDGGCNLLKHLAGVKVTMRVHDVLEIINIATLIFAFTFLSVSLLWVMASTQ